jgi:hypothetical protein
MATTAVRDEFTWASYEAALRVYVEIPTGDDQQLEDSLAVAAIAGDTFLNNPFDGSSDLKAALTGDVLLAVKNGVFAFVKTYISTTGPTAGASTPGLTSVKTGDLSESYGSSSGGLDPAGAAIRSARSAWLPWRVAVWR